VAKGRSGLLGFDFAAMDFRFISLIWLCERAFGEPLGRVVFSYSVGTVTGLTLWPFPNENVGEKYLLPRTAAEGRRQKTDVTRKARMCVK
jgi:hypothetical protein